MSCSTTSGLPMFGCCLAAFMWQRTASFTVRGQGQTASDFAVLDSWKDRLRDFIVNLPNNEFPRHDAPKDGTIYVGDSILFDPRQPSDPPHPFTIQVDIPVGFYTGSILNATYPVTATSLVTYLQIAGIRGTTDGATFEAGKAAFNLPSPMVVCTGIDFSRFDCESRFALAGVFEEQIPAPLPPILDNRYNPDTGRTIHARSTFPRVIWESASSILPNCCVDNPAP